MKDKIRKRIALLKAFDAELYERTRKTKDVGELHDIDVQLSGVRGQQEAHTWMLRAIEEADEAQPHKHRDCAYAYVRHLQELRYGGWASESQIEVVERFHHWVTTAMPVDLIDDVVEGYKEAIDDSQI